MSLFGFHFPHETIIGNFHMPNHNITSRWRNRLIRQQLKYLLLLKELIVISRCLEVITVSLREITETSRKVRFCVPNLVPKLVHNFLAIFHSTNSGAPNDNFRKNICSEDDLRSRIFGTFVVKFLACLPLFSLGAPANYPGS